MNPQGNIRQGISKWQTYCRRSDEKGSAIAWDKVYPGVEYSNLQSKIMKIPERVQKSSYGSTYSQDFSNPMWPGISEVMRQSSLAGLMIGYASYDLSPSELTQSFAHNQAALDIVVSGSNRSLTNSLIEPLWESDPVVFEGGARLIAQAFTQMNKNSAVAGAAGSISRTSLSCYLQCGKAIGVV